MVVNHHRIIVSRVAVGADENGVADNLAGKRCGAVNQVVPGESAGFDFKAERCWLTRGDSPRRFHALELPATPGIFGLSARFRIRLAFGFELLSRTETVVGMALVNQLRGVSGVGILPLGLPVRSERAP